MVLDSSNFEIFNGNMKIDIMEGQGNLLLGPSSHLMRMIKGSASLHPEEISQHKSFFHHLSLSLSIMRVTPIRLNFWH